MARQDEIDRLNDLGRQWGELDDESKKNNKELETEIFKLIYKLYSYKYNPDDMADFFIKFWYKYDPSIAKLSYYIKYFMDKNKNKIIGKDEGWHTQNKKKTRDGSLDAPLANSQVEDKDNTLKETIDDPKSEDIYYEISKDETVVQIMSLFSSIEEHLNGKSNNKKSILYKKMFYTETISDLCQKNILNENYSHERELIESLKLDFLDYYMVQKCRLIIELQNSELKRLSEISEEDLNDNNEAMIPLKQGVIKTYLKKYENMIVSDPNISDQRKKYKQFLKDNIFNSFYT